jgi:hypothetical protein
MVNREWSAMLYFAKSWVDLFNLLWVANLVKVGNPYEPKSGMS